MTRLLAFADVHLGMANFGHLDPATGLHSRILDYLDAMDCVVEAAEIYLPDVILFAGDAFRTRTPNPSLVTHFAERVQRLANVAPVICVVGNHDRQKGGSGKRHAIDILSEVHAAYEIYVSDHIEALCTDDVCVITLPWLYADEISLEDAGQQLDDALATVPAGRPRVLLGHCEVEGALYNDNYVVPFSVGGSGLVYPLSLFTDGAFDMTLLGHVHKNQVLDATWNVAYIGSLERVTWAERRDPKGFITAKLTPGPVDGSVRCYVDWKFHNSLAKSMVEISVDWPRIETLKDWPVDDAIVRVTVMCEDYVGRDTVVSAVHAALQGDYLLDEVYILGRDRIERPTFVGKDLEAKNVMELVEMYLRQQRPDDDEWVSSRLTTAREIIEGEQE